MTKRLTGEELAEIRERVENAEPGSWESVFLTDWDEYIISSDHVCIAQDIDHEGSAEFIANARTDIPKLIAEIERLKADAESSQRLIKLLSQTDGSNGNSEGAKMGERVGRI